MMNNPLIAIALFAVVVPNARAVEVITDFTYDLKIQEFYRI